MTLRCTAALACLLIVITGGSAEAGGIGLRATGGFSRIEYGHFNEYAAVINGLLALDPDITGKLDAIHWIPEAGIEATVSILPVLSLGIGAGAIMGTSSYEVSGDGEALSYEHNMTAYPFTATLYAEVPAPFGFAKPYAFAGGGAYYAMVDFKERVDFIGGEIGYHAELTSWGFGFHGGAGLSFDMMPAVSFDVGVRGRYAKIDGFEGTATDTEGESADIVLGFYEDNGYMIYGPVNAAEAAGKGEGVVDLSGYGFFIGVHVAF